MQEHLYKRHIQGETHEYLCVVELAYTPRIDLLVEIARKGCIYRCARATEPCDEWHLGIRWQHAT
jgi:hypothetical protein